MEVNWICNFRKNHPDLWEFLAFNVLSNCATVVNFTTMWLCTGILFAGWKDRPFRWLLFDYTTPDSLMLCGFLSFLIATALAQIVNFFVQKKLVFRSDVRFREAVWKYVLLAVILVIISAALPAYSQQMFLKWGISEVLIPTLANVLNILVQVVISYPVMKFWIMPNERTKQKTSNKEGNIMNKRNNADKRGGVCK